MRIVVQSHQFVFRRTDPGPRLKDDRLDLARRERGMVIWEALK